MFSGKYVELKLHSTNAKHQHGHHGGNIGHTFLPALLTLKCPNPKFQDQAQRRGREDGECRRGQAAAGDGGAVAASHRAALCQQRGPQAGPAAALPLSDVPALTDRPDRSDLEFQKPSWRGIKLSVRGFPFG